MPSNRMTLQKGVPNPLWHVGEQDRANSAASQKSGITQAIHRFLMFIILSMIEPFNRFVDRTGRGGSLMEFQQEYPV